MANQGNWALTNSLPAHNPKIPKAQSIVDPPQTTSKSSNNHRACLPEREPGISRQSEHVQLQQA